MSESMFLWRSNSKFLAAHPREEGWTVYEFASDTACEMYLHYLWIVFGTGTPTH